LIQYRPKNMQIPAPRCTRRVGAQARERRSVVPVADEKGVEDLAEAVGPGLDVPALPQAVAAPTAVPIKTKAHGTSTATDAIFISKGSIFLPMYSGVRPTMSPATNTATDDEHQHPVQAEPRPEDHLTQLDDHSGPDRPAACTNRASS